MDNVRMVHKLLSVFDIINYRSILLPHRSSIRVQFKYDAEEKTSDFTILSNDIPEDTRKMLVEMLKDNITSDRIIYGLDSNNLEYAELIDKGTWISDISRTRTIISNNELTGHNPMPERPLMIN
jgi:hypothetical protein